MLLLSRRALLTVLKISATDSPGDLALLPTRDTILLSAAYAGILEAILKITTALTQLAETYTKIFH